MTDNITYKHKDELATWLWDKKRKVMEPIIKRQLDKRSGTFKHDINVNIDPKYKTPEVANPKEWIILATGKRLYVGKKPLGYGLEPIAKVRCHFAIRVEKKLRKAIVTTEVIEGRREVEIWWQEIEPQTFEGYHQRLEAAIDKAERDAERGIRIGDPYCPVHGVRGDDIPF
jgi:hypothetical protein